MRGDKRSAGNFHAIVMFLKAEIEFVGLLTRNIRQAWPSLMKAG